MLSSFLGGLCPSLVWIVLGLKGEGPCNGVSDLSVRSVGGCARMHVYVHVCVFSACMCVPIYVGTNYGPGYRGQRLTWGIVHLHLVY